MMTTSVKLPPIIGPIMIPIFVDLGLDIGDSENRFPGVYLQVFTNTIVKFGESKPFFFLTMKTMDINP